MQIPPDWRERPALRAALEALLAGVRRSLAANVPVGKKDFSDKGEKAT